MHFPPCKRECFSIPSTRPRVQSIWNSVSGPGGGGRVLGAFERAWQYLVERHTALRTSFHWEGLKEPGRSSIPAPRSLWSSVTGEATPRKFSLQRSKRS